MSSLCWCAQSDETSSSGVLKDPPLPVNYGAVEVITGCDATVRPPARVPFAVFHGMSSVSFTVGFQYIGPFGASSAERMKSVRINNGQRGEFSFRTVL
jgi:hypothetical protein